jgi:hypothetical protein
LARSESAIGVLQLDGGGAFHASFVDEGAHFRLEGLNAGELPSTPDGLRTLALESAVLNHAFITVLPRHKATLRILTLPSQVPAEIASMVALGTEDLAPYPPEQLAVRHHVLGQLPTGESRVLVVLVHQDVIRHHVEGFQAAGLVPGKIAFSTACIHAVLHAAPNAPLGRYALVCVSANAMEVLVIAEGELVFSRGIEHHVPWKLDDDTDSALGYEIRDALAACRRDSDEQEGIEQLYVTGDRIDAGYLATRLELALGRPCLPATFLDEVLNCEGKSPAGIPVVALGAALAEAARAPLTFDFLPATLVQARAMREVQSGLRRIALSAGLVVALLLTAFGQSVYQRWSLIQELRSEIEAVAPGVEGIAARQQGLEALAHQVDPGGDFLALLAAVAQAAPPEGFNITRVEYDREEGLNLWGRARTKDLVLGDFLGGLRNLGEGSLAQLARAHSQYETPGQERGQEIINYQVSIPALSEETSHDAPAPTR